MADSPKGGMRRSASMGVAAALTRREHIERERTELTKPKFAEEHYDPVEIHKRKQDLLRAEIERARRDTGEAIVHAQVMAEEKERVAEEAKQKDEEMERLREEVAKRTREVNEQRRSFETRHLYLSDELSERRRQEREMKREVSMMRRKVDEQRENVVWERDRAVKALQVACKKEDDINQELSQLPIKVELAMKKRFAEEMGKDKKVDPAMLEALMRKVAGSDELKATLEAVLSDLRSAMDKHTEELYKLRQMERKLSMSSINSVHSIPSSASEEEPPPVVLPEEEPPEESAPPSPASSCLRGYEADHLELFVEDEGHRALRSMSPCFQRLGACLQVAVAAGLAAVASAVLPEPVRRQWPAMQPPETLSVSLCLGRDNKVTTTSVRLVGAADGTATYEADIELPDDIVDSLSPRRKLSTTPRSTHTHRSLYSIPKTSTKKHLNPDPRDKSLTFEERRARHEQRKQEYAAEARRKHLAKQLEEEQEKERRARELRQREAQAIVKRKLTPRKGRKQRMPPTEPTASERVVSAAVVQSNIDDLRPHFMQREIIEQQVLADDSVASNESEREHLPQPPRSPASASPHHPSPPPLKEHSLTTAEPAPALDLAERLRLYSIAVAKGVGVDSCSLSPRRSTTTASVSPSRNFENVFSLHEPKAKHVPRVLQGQVFALHSSSAHSDVQGIPQPQHVLSLHSVQGESYALPTQPETVSSPLYNRRTSLRSSRPSLQLSETPEPTLYQEAHSAAGSKAEKEHEATIRQDVEPTAPAASSSCPSAKHRKLLERQLELQQQLDAMSESPLSPVEGQQSVFLDVVGGSPLDARSSSSNRSSHSSPHLPMFTELQATAVRQELPDATDREKQEEPSGKPQAIEKERTGSGKEGRERPKEIDTQGSSLAPSAAASPGSRGRSVVALDDLGPPGELERVSFMDDISVKGKQGDGFRVNPTWTSPFDTTSQSDQASPRGCARTASGQTETSASASSPLLELGEIVPRFEEDEKKKDDEASACRGLGSSRKLASSTASLSSDLHATLLRKVREGVSEQVNIFMQEQFSEIEKTREPQKGNEQPKGPPAEEGEGEVAALSLTHILISPPPEDDLQKTDVAPAIALDPSPSSTTGDLSQSMQHKLDVDDIGSTDPRNNRRMFYEQVSEEKEEERILKEMLEESPEMLEQYNLLPPAEKEKVKQQLRADLRMREVNRFAGDLDDNMSSPVTEALDAFHARRARSKSMLVRTKPGFDTFLS